ncbi:MAG TPA: YggT family protein [Tissierellia bacterium]|nr:YggT family protein [Tissierellia bacterium]
MLTIYRAISILFEIIELLILVRIIMSWFRIGYYNTFGRIVYEMTEPILSFARELINRLGINTGILDFSPIVALLILRLIMTLLRAIVF